MARPPPPIIPLEDDLRERWLWNRDVNCSCGTAENHPFADEEPTPGSAEVVDFIRRMQEIDAKSMDSQPPRKRQKTKTAVGMPESTDDASTKVSDHVIVLRDNLRFEFATSPAQNNLHSPIKYTCFDGHVRTHVAKLAGPHDEYRMVISECRSKTDHQRLLDFRCDSTKTDLQAIEIAGKVAHWNRKDSAPGNFWTETTFEASANGPLTRIIVTWELKWNMTPSLAEHFRPPAKFEPYIMDWMVQKLLPEHSLDSFISTRTFYRSIHAPPGDDVVADHMPVDGVSASLYPYQRRSVRWMLGREGVDWSIETNSLVRSPRGHSVDTLHKGIDVDGKLCWVSPVHNLVATSRAGFANDDISGGLLLEEMGLGKTVEIISLITLHQRQLGQEATVFDDFTSTNVTPIRATLIICPPAILKQWEDELDLHAPTLNVFTYKGINAHKDMTKAELIGLFPAHDVVLTTYQVISREIHYVTPPPLRNLRSRPSKDQSQHSPTISPLVQFSWWRTILDEVQMIDGGMSNAARVAKIIPRVNAWGVTGTPVKSDLEGMHSLLDFLRYEPFASDKNAWKALLTRDKRTFLMICQRLAIRHTKQLVRDEMSLPAQKRYVMRMPFTPIEEHHYQQIYAEACDDCKVTEFGEPLDFAWNPVLYEQKMHHWLSLLRINTLYPGVKGVGANRNQPKRSAPQTASDLLDFMLMENLTNLHRVQRQYLQDRIERGKIFAFSYGVKNPRAALEMWTGVVPEADGAVELARKTLQDAMEQHEQAKASRASSPDQPEAHVLRLGETKVPEKIGVLTAQLTNMLILAHTASFLCGNGFFALKEVLPERREVCQRKEDEFYEKAKLIRQEFLNDVYEKCNHPMKKLQDKLDKGIEKGGLQIIPMAVRPSKIDLPTVAREAAGLLGTLSSFLNEQRHLIFEWRETTVILLCSPLVDSRDAKAQSITGDEYEQSAKDQDHVVLYVQALRALIEDRYDILAGGTNQLILGEMRESLKQAKETKGPDPQLALELSQQRSELLRKADGITFPDLQAAVRRTMGELRTEINRSADADDIVCLSELEDSLRKIKEGIAQQMGVIPALRSECAEFTRLMNYRVEYYRQLQQLSDEVQDWDGYDRFRNAENQGQVMGTMIMAEHRVKSELAQLKTRRRYLEHLESPNVERDGLPDCLICTDEYEKGAMTVCGHFFCRDCMYRWLHTRGSCPICKKKLQNGDVHWITHKTKELKAHKEEAMPSHLTRKAVAEGIFSELSKKDLDEIMNIELPGPSLTTKVDTLCRHIIWLKKRDSTTKCLVFSQYTGFLDYLKRAFDNALLPEGIRYASIADRGGIHTFKTDPDTAVFLLDAKSQSSGLNLVEASHVFLCEPLINTAIELQAISRVDRIGQKKETTVWLYIIDGTVEENIYDISVRRRLEHIPLQRRESNLQDPADMELGLEAANSAELAQHGNIQKLLNPKDKSSGELVPRSDLVSALWSNRKQMKACPRCAESFQLREFEAHINRNNCRVEAPEVLNDEWTEVERRCFPVLLEHFGTDWPRVADWLGTKTVYTCRDLFMRAREEWEEVARRGNEKRDAAPRPNPANMILTRARP